MRLLIILAVVAVAKAKVIEYCTGVEVHGLNHEKEVLKRGLDSPYQLAIDYDTNYLFFSYSTNNDPNQFKSAYINLKTNEFGVINGITGGFANAVDSRSHVVYLGGNDGIYKFDFDTKRANFVGARGESIWQLYYKDKLYYTDYPTENAYIFNEDGVSKRVPELENTKSMLLALDGNDNVFYSNSSGLFCYLKDESKTIQLGDYNVNGFTKDLNNNVFFSTPGGIYTIDKNGKDVIELAVIENVYGVAIEADNNIIYSDGDSIVRLTPTKQKCISESKLFMK